MAYDTTPHDVYRGTDGIVLPSEISREIWAKTLETSAIMRMARRIYLPGPGITVPIITGDGIADVVTEATEKPVSNPTFSDKVMTPVKIAMIQTFSNEFRRDLPRLYDAIIDRAPRAIDAKFDAMAMHGTSNPTGFDTLANATAVKIDNGGATAVYSNLVGAKHEVAKAGGMLDGWIMAPQGEIALLGAVDTTGRPIFIDSATTQGSVGRILGESVYFNRHAFQSDAAADTIGVAGDWSKAYYGVVEDITVKFSDQATINDGTKQLNLWQRNMFAVLIEATLGFAVEDDAYFVRLTKTHEDESES